MGHHQLLREPGTCEGMAKPRAGKQFSQPEEENEKSNPAMVAAIGSTSGGRRPARTVPAENRDKNKERSNEREVMSESRSMFSDRGLSRGGGVGTSSGGTVFIPPKPLTGPTRLVGNWP